MPLTGRKESDNDVTDRVNKVVLVHVGAQQEARDFGNQDEISNLYDAAGIYASTVALDKLKRT